MTTDEGGAGAEAYIIGDPADGGEVDRSGKTERGVRSKGRSRAGRAMTPKDAATAASPPTDASPDETGAHGDPLAGKGRGPRPARVARAGDMAANGSSAGPQPTAKTSPKPAATPSAKAKPKPRARSTAPAGPANGATKVRSKRAGEALRPSTPLSLVDGPAEIVWDRPPVGVLVVDGDSEGRHRLSQIISRGAHVRLTGSVGTLADAVEVAKRTTTEVVLSELFLPDGDPIALKQRFVPLAPRPQLVVITRFSVRGARVASANAGARTCLASGAPADSVVAAILAAAAGESWDGAGSVGNRFDRVSPLEAKVLAGVASGATNEEIARALGYSVHYVKDLLEAVRGRLGAKDRAHAASLAVSLKLIRPARDGRFISAVLS